MEVALRRDKFMSRFCIVHTLNNVHAERGCTFHLEHIEDVRICLLQPGQPGLEHGGLCGVDNDLGDPTWQCLPKGPHINALAPCKDYRLGVTLTRLRHLYSRTSPGLDCRT